MTATLRAALQRAAGALGVPEAEFVIERPRDPGHGDWATNLALALARPLKANPRQAAARVLEHLDLPDGLVTRVEVAGPGFINFWLAEPSLAAGLAGLIRAGASYGRSEVGRGRRVNVEFVSANPTGPLHVGHGRGAALGDAIAELLHWTGHEVTREFYVNDAGAQIDRLVESLWARVRQVRDGDAAAGVPEGGYHGEYLLDAARQALAELPVAREAASLPDAAPILREFILRGQRAEQDALLRDFGVRFDRHSFESRLYQDGQVAEALRQLAARGLTFEAEGALWLKSSAFGDDKDRVLRKRDGDFTYLMPDVAYHVEKHDRGFDLAIDVWGADHHGYVSRLRAALAGLGYPPGFFEVAIVQLVKVVRGGEEVRMSKRAGDYVTLRDLCDWVGVDAARYFFLMRRGDTPFVFDVDLAARQTEENPVFYVQMAHARLSGLFRVAGLEPEAAGDTVDPAALPAPDDTDLLKALLGFPEVVARAAAGREPHRVTTYLADLARLVHGWYHHCRVVGEAAATERARLVLARGARVVLGNGLRLLGLRAPDRM